MNQFGNNGAGRAGHSYLYANSNIFKEQFLKNNLVDKAVKRASEIVFEYFYFNLLDKWFFSGLQINFFIQALEVHNAVLKKSV